jgi:hypothetical protein
MGVELEWRLQIMTEVGNAIMENGSLERVGRSFSKGRTTKKRNRSGEGCGS